MPDAVPRPHRRGVQPQTATRGRVRGVLLPLRPERTAARRCQDPLGILQEYEYRRRDVCQRDPIPRRYELLRWRRRILRTNEHAACNDCRKT